MKTEIEMMQDVIMYACNLAKGNSDYQDCAILTGNRVNKIEESEARLHMQTTGSTLRQIALQIEDIHANGAYDDCRGNAIALFQYVFDWAYEAFYYTIIGNHEKEVYVDIEEALVEKEFDYSIPEYLKTKVDKIVPKITSIAFRVHQYVQEQGYTELPISRWFYLYLGSSASIAEQFLLEQDLNS